MKKVYIGLLLLTVVFESCHNCGPCPVYPTALTMMRVRIVSKTTGDDLFLSPTSPYKPSDLKVSSSIRGENIQFVVDSSDRNNRSIFLDNGSSVTYTLQLANLAPDHIKIAVGPSSQKCCAATEIQSIMLDDSLVCAPCSFDQSVVIKK